MQKFTIIFSLLLIICSQNANAQEDNPKDTTKTQDSVQIQNNLRTSIHLHPITLIPLLATNHPILYVTIEKPLDLSKSLIIKPSFWSFDVTNANTDGDMFYTYRFGSDFGIRYYPAKKGEGFYCQGQAGLFYMAERDVTPVVHYDAGIWIDAMGYLGGSIKYERISAFFDIGIGLYYKSLGSSNMRIFHNDQLLVDMNLGIGFSF